jgi:hypothetical protein
MKRHVKLETGWGCLVTVMLIAFWLTFCHTARADQTIFQPVIYSTGSSLTLQSGITTTFASGSITDFASGSSVDFTGATVTGLAAAGGTVTSITATAPIVVTPTPLTTTGVISISGSTLSKTDDTNVTLTLGGSPLAALLAPASITAGWTGTLAVARGGTGAATAAANTVFGNNTASTAAPVFSSSPRFTAIGNLTSNGFVKTSGGIGTLSVDTATYESPLTFSTGLTRSINTVTVNPSQNITTLSNLTTNGFVKTSSGNGTLVLDTAVYLTGNQTITLTGAVTGSGSTSIATSYGSAVPTASGGVPTGGAAGQVLEKNTATNYDAGWVTPAVFGSHAQQSAIGNADTYIPGSMITIPAGDVAVGTVYHALLVISKTGAGTASGPLIMRMGTAGSTSDTTAVSNSMGTAGTAAIDVGTIELYAKFIAVGASAQVLGIILQQHNNTSAGLWNTGTLNSVTGTGTTGSTFNSTTATKIGLSYSAGTSGSHTITVVKAELYRQ